MTAAETPPPPLEWHPAYRDQTWLLDWLEGRDGERPTDRYRLPVQPSPRELMRYDPDVPIVPEVLRERVLVKHRAAGFAPYVGHPFRYEWFFATDELGRAIAGEVRIRHASPDFLFCSGPAEYTSDARNGHDPGTPVWP